MKRHPKFSLYISIFALAISTVSLEVFELIRRLNGYIEYEKEEKVTTQTESNVIVRPAGDNWF